MFILFLYLPHHPHIILPSYRSHPPERREKHPPSGNCVCGGSIGDHPRTGPLLSSPLIVQLWLESPPLQIPASRPLSYKYYSRGNHISFTALHREKAIYWNIENKHLLISWPFDNQSLAARARGKFPAGIKKLIKAHGESGWKTYFLMKGRKVKRKEEIF